MSYMNFVTINNELSSFSWYLLLLLLFLLLIIIIIVVISYNFFPFFSSFFTLFYAITYFKMLQCLAFYSRLDHRRINKFIDLSLPWVPWCPALRKENFFLSLLAPVLHWSIFARRIDCGFNFSFFFFQRISSHDTRVNISVFLSSTSCCMVRGDEQCNKRFSSLRCDFFQHSPFLIVAECDASSNGLVKTLNDHDSLGLAFYQPMFLSRE